jgi:UPF0042 nucleotide-binding protein
VDPVIVVTGLSGSGKSLAARCFEDQGYFCIDNLPVTLIPVLLDLIARSRAEVERIALVVDVREGEMLRDFPGMIAELRGRRVVMRILYFEASNEVLMRRFSETRRPHPLNAGDGLEDAINRERQRLDEVRELADRIIDTSRFNAHELRAFLKKEFEPESVSTPIAISVISFGFKYGLPLEADVVFDARFIPNPFFVEGLKAKTGQDRAVVEFLERKSEYRGFQKKAGDLLRFLLPGFVNEGKTYLTIAVGCTGGKHRSVAAAESFAEQLRASGYPCRVSHRDIGKE